jgi:hypothetical protein
VAAACGDAVTQVTGPDAPRCAISFDKPPAAVPATASQFALGIVTDRDCLWSAQSDVSWIQVSPTDGQGATTVNVSVSANTQAAPRNGVVSVNGYGYSVTQAAAAGTPCSYTLSPTSRTINENGGSRTVQVTTGVTCPWMATSSVPWITFESATSGVGTATITYRVARNTDDAPRIGVITIGGRTHTVVQSGD